MKTISDFFFFFEIAKFEYSYTLAYHGQNVSRQKEKKTKQNMTYQSNRKIKTKQNKIIKKVKNKTKQNKKVNFEGVLHPWTLFLKTLCIFSKHKEPADKRFNGSD